MGEVNAELTRIFEDTSSQAARIHGGALEMMTAVRDFTCRPGKRLRPILMRVVYEGLGGTNTEAIIRASCTMELMQSFFLIHDDIMDRSDLRRGEPTLHRWYENRYTELAVDGRHFGSAMALLAGDLASQLAMTLLSHSSLAPNIVARALSHYSQIAIDVCYGQVLDMLLPQRPLNEISEDEVWKVMEYKTARYTVEGPMHLGAILAGAEDTILEHLSAYGVPLGVAFQLQDDILGIFGEETLTGKSAASDLTDGKRTLLLLKAWKRANEKERRLLHQVLGNPQATHEEIRTARRVLEATGARRCTMQLAQELVTQAKQGLVDLSLTDSSRRFLIELADFVLGRER